MRSMRSARSPALIAAVGVANSDGAAASRATTTGRSTAGRIPGRSTTGGTKSASASHTRRRRVAAKATPPRTSNVAAAPTGMAQSAASSSAPTVPTAGGGGVAAAGSRSLGAAIGASAGSTATGGIGVAVTGAGCVRELADALEGADLVCLGAVRTGAALKTRSAAAPSEPGVALAASGTTIGGVAGAVGATGGMTIVGGDVVAVAALAAGATSCA